MADAPTPASVAEMKEALAAADYLADEPAALVSYLAQRLGKPVLVEGPAGVGKTELAKALSRASGRDLIRLQCYEGLDESKALYEWNYRKQLLAIQAKSAAEADGALLDDIFAEDYLLARPLMQAIASPDPVVLLIDEIDKTDQEFEAMLLELLSDFQITIPELGQISATTMPIVILTSNNSRELTEALKRRCLYLWLDYPELERNYGDRPPPRAGASRDPGPASGRGGADGARPRPQEAALDRRVDRLGAHPAADGRRRHRPRDLPAVDVDHRQAPHRHRPGRGAGRDEDCAGRRNSASVRTAAAGPGGVVALLRQGLDQVEGDDEEQRPPGDQGRGRRPRRRPHRPGGGRRGPARGRPVPPATAGGSASRVARPDRVNASGVAPTGSVEAARRRAGGAGGRRSAGPDRRREARLGA